MSGTSIGRALLAGLPMTRYRRARIRRALRKWRREPGHGCAAVCAHELGLDEDELKLAESYRRRPPDWLLERVERGLAGDRCTVTVPAPRVVWKLPTPGWLL